MIVSVHIPKTAGTAFQQLLADHFGSRLYLAANDRPLAPGYGLRMLRQRSRCWAGQIEIDPTRYDCIHGHVLARRFDYLGDIRRFVWLRDPVQRVASHYHYWRRSPDLRNADCRRMVEHDMSLEEFAALPRMRNVQTRFVDGCALVDFAFVGLVEDVANSLRRFSVATGIAGPVLHMSNVNDSRQGDAYAISTVQAQRLAALNSLDVALYAEASLRFGNAATTAD